LTRAAFVLLEVTLSLLILAVTMGAALRAYIMGMNAIRENRILTVATLMAETLMDDLEIEPPIPGRMGGSFKDDPRFGEAYSVWSWERMIEEEEIKYEQKSNNPLQEAEPLYTMELKILYDDGTRQRTPLIINTFLMSASIYSDATIQTNQLF
jgi:hypothetical protein